MAEVSLQRGLLDPKNPIVEEESRGFLVDDAPVSLRCQVLFPSVLYAAAEAVDGVREGSIIFQRPEGTADVHDGIFHANVELAHVGAKALEEIHLLQEDEGYIVGLLQDVWSLRGERLRDLEPMRAELRHFAGSFLQQHREHPTIRAAYEHLLRSPGMHNGVGPSPFTAAPPLWASHNRIAERAEGLMELRFQAVATNEGIRLYLDRLFRFVEETRRVALSELESMPFWGCGEERRQKLPDMVFRHWANIQRRMRIRPLVHLCSRNAVDFDAAANLYEERDVPGTADRLQRIVEACTNFLVGFHLFDLHRAAWLDWQSKTQISHESFGMLRYRMSAFIAHPALQRPALKLVALPMDGEAREARERLQTTIEEVNGTVSLVRNIVEEGGDGVCERICAAIEPVRPKF